MKTILIAASIGLLGSSQGLADDLCQALKTGPIAELEIMPRPLTKEQWKQTDVLVTFPFAKCADTTMVNLFEVNGTRVWHYKTNDHACDGDNPYGAYYSYDRTEMIAHILDGDIYCADEIPENDPYRAENHKCDLMAEAYAVKTLANNGFVFENTDSLSETRRTPYLLKQVVSVTGTISNLDDRQASVDIYTNSDCSRMVVGTGLTLKLDKQLFP